MKIILSPAKKMREADDDLQAVSQPVFREQAETLLQWMRSLSYDEAKALWGCSDRLARENYERLQTMRIGTRQTPAILAYDGIAFQSMAPAVFDRDQLLYVQDHLRILSGFYGVLRPMDGVVPYRLEMQAKVQAAGIADLYEYWGRQLYDAVMDESRLVINLASREYSRCIEKYLTKEDCFITCVFGEQSGTGVVQKGVYAKMARGDMVRFMAEEGIETPEALHGYDRMGYRWHEALSDEKNFVFVR